MNVCWLSIKKAPLESLMTQIFSRVNFCMLIDLCTVHVYNLEAFSIYIGPS